MNDTPTAAPPREDDASRIAAYFIEAEGGQLVRDMAGHVGDEIHEVLKRHGLTMATAAGAIGVGVLAGVQVLNETLGFAVRSVDTDAERASIVAGVAALVDAHIDHRLIRTVRSRAEDDVRRAFQQVCDEIAPAKAYAESCGLEGGKLPSAVHIKLGMIHGYARDGLAALTAMSAAAEQPTKGFSRFDPPGLWESEARSTGVVIKEAGER